MAPTMGRTLRGYELERYVATNRVSCTLRGVIRNFVPRVCVD